MDEKSETQLGLLGVFLLIFTIFSVALDPTQSRKDHTKCKSEAHKVYNSTLNQLPIGSELPPAVRQENQKKRGEAKQKELENFVLCSDLNAQWSMSFIGYLGLLAGFIGLLAIMATLWQTMKAARAAVDTLDQAKLATDAAQESVNVAISASLPFLDIFAAKVVRDKHNHGSLEIAVKNLGSNAARNVIFVGTYTRYKRSDDNGIFHDGEPIVEDTQSERVSVAANSYNVLDVPFFDWASLEEHLSNVSDSEIHNIHTAEQILKHIRFEGVIRFTDQMGKTRSFEVNLYQHTRYGKDGYDLNGISRHARAGYYEKEYRNPA